MLINVIYVCAEAPEFSVCSTVCGNFYLRMFLDGNFCYYKIEEKAFKFLKVFDSELDYIGFILSNKIDIFNPNIKYNY